VVIELRDGFNHQALRDKAASIGLGQKQSGFYCMEPRAQRALIIDLDIMLCSCVGSFVRSVRLMSTCRNKWGLLQFKIAYFFLHSYLIVKESIPQGFQAFFEVQPKRMYVKSFTSFTTTFLSTAKRKRSSKILTILYSLPIGLLGEIFLHLIKRCAKNTV
jgi:hypothetical protein